MSTQMSKAQHAELHKMADKIAAMLKGVGLEVPEVLLSFDGGTNPQTKVFFNMVAEEKAKGVQKTGHLWRTKDGKFGQVCISPNICTREAQERGDLHLFLTIGLILAKAEADGVRGGNMAHVNGTVKQYMERAGVLSVFKVQDKTTGAVVEKPTGPLLKGTYTVPQGGPLGKLRPSLGTLPYAAEVNKFTNPKGSKRTKYTITDGTAGSGGVNLLAKPGIGEWLQGLIGAKGTVTWDKAGDTAKLAEASTAPAAGEPSAPISAQPTKRTTRIKKAA